MGLTLITPSVLHSLTFIMLHVCVCFEKESEGECSLYLTLAYQEQSW